MTTMTPTSAWTRLNKVGLGLTIFYGVTNLPTVLVPTGEGDDGPPLEISALCSVLSVVAIVAGVIAWRKVSRRAARLAAGAIVLITVSSLPAFFVDVPAVVKVLVGLGVVWTIAAVVLTFTGRRNV